LKCHFSGDAEGEINGALLSFAGALL